MATTRAAFERVMLAQLRGMLQLSRVVKRLMAAAVDALLCAMAVWIAYSLRMGTWVLDSVPVWTLLATAFVFWPPIFVMTGVYRTIFRFTGMRSIFTIGLACAILAVPMCFVFMLIGVPGVPRTLGIMFPLIFFMLVAISRIVARYMFVEILNQRDFTGATARALVYGAGFSGQQLSMSLRNEPAMWVRGFIDDDDRLDGQRLDGVPIFHARRLQERIEQMDIDTILLAMPKISRARRKQIVDQLQEYKVRVLTLPGVTQVLEGKVSVSDLREIAVEELLGREPVAPNSLLLARTIVGKTVMVTGAGGSIGGELCRQILAIGPVRLVMVEMTEHALYEIEQELIAQRAADERLAPVELVAELGNVTDAPSIRRIVKRYAPDTLFHAAAYKHVPLVEANPVGGLRNNVLGTLAAARAAEEAGVSHFILISTDKAVRPTNVMGATKRVCEQVLQALAARGSATRFAMVRFGNVLGSSGSVVPRFRAQIAAGGPVTLTHRDITRYFMTIPEAAQLVIQAGAMAKGGDVYLLDMGKPVRIIDLARTMISLSGRSLRTAANPDGDIAIEEVGLRPGEKLYEELLIGDGAEPTNHPRIMRSHEAFLPWADLEPALDALADATARGDEAEALAVLRRLVPEYRPESAMAEAQHA